MTYQGKYPLSSARLLHACRPSVLGCRCCFVETLPRLHPSRPGLPGLRNRRQLNKPNRRVLVASGYRHSLLVCDVGRPLDTVAERCASSMASSIARSCCIRSTTGAGKSDSQS